jgi:hypothetical protein
MRYQEAIVKWSAASPTDKSRLHRERKLTHREGGRHVADGKDEEEEEEEERGGGVKGVRGKRGGGGGGVDPAIEEALQAIQVRSKP